MRTWLVVASFDEQGVVEPELRLRDADSLERVTYVRSKEDQPPTNADVAAALEGRDAGEFLLLPLDAGVKATSTVTTTVDVRVTVEASS